MYFTLGDCRKPTLCERRWLGGRRRRRRRSRRSRCGRTARWRWWVRRSSIQINLKPNPKWEVAGRQAPAEAPEPAEPEWAYGALETVEAAQFYNAVSRTGIQYGPHFRMVRRTNIAPDTAAQLRCEHALLSSQTPQRQCPMVLKPHGSHISLMSHGSHISQSQTVHVIFKVCAACACQTRIGFPDIFWLQMRFTGAEALSNVISPFHTCPAARRRWDRCFIRLLDGMLQVIGFADADGSDHSLRIPVRIRHIEIGAPGGTDAPALECTAERALGRVATPLAAIQGLELAAAPRSAAATHTKRAPDPTGS